MQPLNKKFSQTGQIIITFITIDKLLVAMTITTLPISSPLEEAIICSQGLFVCFCDP
jgi:hypothetical protein